MNEKSSLSTTTMTEDNGSGCTNTSCCPPKMPITRDAPKTGRNDPCICGNGRKFKKCCGRNV
ncbi:MAG: SEC-C metal-binding domain-containing protein [Porticoccaceae bacterium]